ncbi:barstar family protein [Pseudonocardia bannensis]|uniref:Barstar family protein n=2 Tax=Pseudonocardia bannensis TaxID=630973 RepID=A0A848DF89_9PSEU|nr:barstar family protein [Pseudonocardia bannensis]
MEARLRGATVGTVGSVDDRADLLVAVARALRFPGYFGHNLDALHDSLTDLSWLPAGQVVLVWDGSDTLRRADPIGYRSVFEVLTSAVEHARDGLRPLRVVLTEPAEQ